jgi:hypothetical protein
MTFLPIVGQEAVGWLALNLIGEILWMAPYPQGEPGHTGIAPSTRHEGEESGHAPAPLSLSHPPYHY